jgi:nucleoside-diphosphate-sugar epimerase
MGVTGKKIIVTGATGQIGRPVAESLAADNEVWCLARFSNPAMKEELEALGLRTFRWDMTEPDLTGLPDDITHVFHAAVVGEYDDQTKAIPPTCEATADLMMHCRNAEAFAYTSSTIVYEPLEQGHRYQESDVLGGLSSPTFMPAYAPTKISAEATVRAMSHVLGLRSTIARVNLAYGFPKSSVNMGRMIPRYVKTIQAGEPLAVREPVNYISPIHCDDIVRQVPDLWRIASVPVTVMNWGSDDYVTEREIIEYVAELIGLPAKIETSELAPMTVAEDSTYRQSLIGHTHVTWRDGVRRAVEEYAPEALV